jgi:hypothetical protein
VLLFPHGENGWHPDLKLNEPEKDNPKRLSHTRYVAYWLQFREDRRSAILRGGRFLQRYMVGMWATADQNRLRYLRNNQPKLRASLYSGLEDYGGRYPPASFSEAKRAGDHFIKNSAGHRPIVLRNQLRNLSLLGEQVQYCCNIL